MAAQNSTGIQTLLDAEREAAKIVQNAREFRTKRIKEAQAEAKAEIEAYKASKEDEFTRFESQHAAGKQAAENEANKESDTSIRRLREAGLKNEGVIANDLLEAVFHVKYAVLSSA